MATLSHNGTFTIESPSGGHRTLRVRTARGGKLEGKRIIGLLTGPDNERDYTDFGFVLDDAVVVWRKFRAYGSNGFVRSFVKSGHSEFEQIAGMFWEVVAQNFGPIVDIGYTYTSATVCRVCNRKLTTPESVESGVGPECGRRGR